MPTFPQITSPPQAAGEVLVNRMGETLSGIAAFGKKQSTTTGLTWGGYGCDLYNGNVVADWTVAQTDGATNYIVVLRSTGVVSVSTSSANSVNPLYAKLYKNTCAGGVVTASVDQRFDTNGLFQGVGGAAAGVELKGLTFTSDTGSTADSDPGNGLFKWNNATEASATFLYFDNQTADAISTTTFFASLGASGFIYLQQYDDSSKWQMWKWTALPTAGSGYYKFAVTLQANGGTIADDKTVYCTFSGISAASSTTPIRIQVACSDETTALTTGTAKATFRAPCAFTLTDVRASVTTAPTGGTLLTVDVNEAGTTVLSTKLTFDASEKTTTTAATPRVISDSAIADDAEITIDIDAVGSTIAGAGLKVTLIGTVP